MAPWTSTNKANRAWALNLLKKSMRATIARVIQYPDAWFEMSENSRRCLVNRFPYGLIYQIKANELRIIAVAHLHRRPNYWKKRMGQNKSLKRDAAKSRRRAP